MKHLGEVWRKMLALQCVTDPWAQGDPVCTRYKPWALPGFLGDSKHTLEAAAMLKRQSWVYGVAVVHEFFKQHRFLIQKKASSKHHILKSQTPLSIHWWKRGFLGFSLWFFFDTGPAKTFMQGTAILACQSKVDPEVPSKCNTGFFCSSFSHTGRKMPDPHSLSWWLFMVLF